MAGAAVGVVASTAVITKLQSKRVDAGAVLLHNALVGRDDPTSLRREEVVAIGQRCIYTSPRASSAARPGQRPWIILEASIKSACRDQCPCLLIDILLHCASHKAQCQELHVSSACKHAYAGLCRVGGDLSLKLVDDLKRIYDTYLESVVPPGDIPLK